MQRRIKITEVVARMLAESEYEIDAIHKIVKFIQNNYRRRKK